MFGATDKDKTTGSKKKKKKKTWGRATDNRSASREISSFYKPGSLKK